MELKEYLDLNLVHSIHTSERRSFRSCRRRWDLAYRQMWYPRITPPPLEFGVAFHAAMEKFYDPQTWAQDWTVKQGMALITFRKECDDQLKNYEKLNGQPEVDVLTDYKQRVILGLNMIRYYTEKISPQYDTKFIPEAVEVPFEIMIMSPDGQPIWCKCERCWKRYVAYVATKYSDDIALGPQADWFRRNKWQGLPVSYGGRLDMLAKDDQDRYWIFDWKTTSRILDEDAESSFLQLDDQISSYVWALRSLGLPVAGFVYVEIRKAFPQSPQELSRPYRGRMFSTNKQLFTTVEIFEATVKEKDEFAFLDGAYDEHLNWLRKEGPKFHQRHQIHKNEREIDEIGRNIWLEAQEIVNNPRVYPMPGRFSCNTCLYRQVCLGMNMQEDYLYTLESMFERREKHYYESEEIKPSTE